MDWICSAVALLPGGAASCSGWLAVYRSCRLL